MSVLIAIFPPQKSSRVSVFSLCDLLWSHYVLIRHQSSTHGRHILGLICSSTTPRSVYLHYIREQCLTRYNSRLTSGCSYRYVTTLPVVEAKELCHVFRRMEFTCLIVRSSWWLNTMKMSIRTYNSISIGHGRTTLTETLSLPEWPDQA